MPLIQFADCVRSIQSTRLDLLALGTDIPALHHFDEIITWYGTNQPDFRGQLTAIQPNSTFLDALPPKDTRNHATDFFLEQVGAPQGATPLLTVTPPPRRNSVVIHPFSGSKTKNWPLAKFQALATQLPIAVEWTAGPEEALLNANRFGNLLDLASWLQGAHAYLGNDSGISHLAAAIGIPTIVLFGPTDPAIWAPRGNSVIILRKDPISNLEITPVRQAIEKYF